MRRCYWAWLGLILCMFFNFIAVTAALIGIGSAKMGSWLWSIIWMLGGIPGAYIFWWAWRACHQPMAAIAVATAATAA